MKHKTMSDMMKGPEVPQTVRRDDGEREKNDSVMLSEHRRLVIGKVGLEERLGDLIGSIRSKVGLEREDIPDFFPNEEKQSEFIGMAMSRYGMKSGLKWMSDDEMRALLNEYADTVMKFEEAKEELDGAGQSLKESDIFVRRRREFGNLVSDQAINAMSEAVSHAKREALLLRGQKGVQESKIRQADTRAEELRQNLNVLLSLKELMKDKHQDILERLDAIKVLRTVLEGSKSKTGQAGGGTAVVPERETVELGDIIERNKEEHQRIMGAARNAIMEGRYELVGDIVAKLIVFDRQLMSNTRRRCPSLFSEGGTEDLFVRTPTPDVDEGDASGYVRVVASADDSSTETGTEGEQPATQEQIEALKKKFGL